MATETLTKQAERLRKAISALDRKTIEFLAYELGSSEYSSVRANTWTDCPMTLAQRVGNTLNEKYRSESAVSAFATAWDAFMSSAVSVYQTSNDLSSNGHKLTNGFGVDVINDLARQEIIRQDNSKTGGIKRQLVQWSSTNCSRDDLANKQIDAILDSLEPDRVEVPNKVIKLT